MIPVRGYAGHRVAVLGLGRSGLPTVAALRAGGAEVVAWDDGEPARARAEADGVAIADLTRAGAWAGVKALIVSPGIPHLYPAPHPAVAAAWDAGVAVDNDIGLFFRSFATEAWNAFDRTPQVVGITGSNGKSTTTALLAHVLAGSGRPVQTGGNIGRGVLDLDPAADGMVVVLELSSYQIELARALQPDIAVFLNLSPDHLDRHGGMGGYFAAKRRLFTQGGPSRSIIGIDENEGRFLANAMREEAGTGDPVITVSVTRKPGGPGWGVFARKGLPRRVARRAAGRLDRPAGDADPAGRAQPPERLRRVRGGAQPRHGTAADRGAARLLSGIAAPQPARRHPSRRPHRQRQQGDQRRCGRARPRQLRAHPLDRRGPAEGGRDRGAAVAFSQNSKGLPDRRGGGGVRGDARGYAARGVGDARGRRWRRRSPRPRPGRRCCSRRPAPASTSSRASRPGGRLSRRWCAGTSGPGEKPAGAKGLRGFAAYGTHMECIWKPYGT